MLFIENKFVFQIRQAYANARQRNLWQRGSYAMSNALEYWAEATGVFLHANRATYSNGGMSR